MNLEITKYANSKYSTEYLAIEKMTKVEIKDYLKDKC